MKILKIGFEFFWKSLVIGLLNLVSLIIVSGFLTKIGLKFPELNSDFTFIMLMMFISGFITSIMSGIIVKNLKLSKLRAFIVLYPMLLLNSITQLLEALFFAPGIISWETAPAVFGQQFIMYLVLTAGVVLLFRNNYETSLERIKLNRNFQGWFWRILLSSAGYVLFYFIFGSINAMLFTGEYYRSQIKGLSLPSTFEILMLEPVRALILVLSILPVIVNLKVSKKKCMVITGMWLFIIGGLLPMLQQLNTLPLSLIIASVVEMFFQFFLTGVVTTCIILYQPNRCSNEGV